MTVVVTMNMKVDLPLDAADDGLTKLLAQHPHLMVLTEWGQDRNELLEAHARLLRPWPWQRRWKDHPTRGMAFTRCRGGGEPVGWDAGRWVWERTQMIVLARGRKVMHADGFKDRQPANVGTLVTLIERKTGQRWQVFAFHFTAHVQSDQQQYDRPQDPRVMMHREERWAVEEYGARAKRDGIRFVAAGDTNWDRLALRGLTACWVGTDRVSTLGNRDVDLIYTAHASSRTRVIDTPSDHRAKLAHYSDDHS